MPYPETHGQRQGVDLAHDCRHQALRLPAPHRVVLEVPGVGHRHRAGEGAAPVSPLLPEVLDEQVGAEGVSDGEYRRLGVPGMCVRVCACDCARSIALHRYAPTAPGRRLCVCVHVIRRACVCGFSLFYGERMLAQYGGRRKYIPGRT